MRAIFYSIDTKLYTNIWYGSLIKAKKSHIIWPDKKWHISKPRITRRKGAKFNMKNIAKRLASLALGFALVLGIGVSLDGVHSEVVGVRAAEEVVYTLTPSAGKNNSYAGSEDITINTVEWNATGNVSLTPWRIGGKNISSENRLVYSKTAIQEKISKVVLTVQMPTKDNVTVNSLTFSVHSSAENSAKGTTDSSSISKTEISSPSINTTDTTFTFSNTENADWENKYYSFNFSVTNSTKNNKYVFFVKAEFYKESNPDAHVVTITSADDNVELKDGNTLVMTATCAQGDDVKWSSGDTSIATIDESTGVLTPVNVGSVVITATCSTDSTATATKTITVWKEPDVITSKTVADVAALATGEDKTKLYEVTGYISTFVGTAYGNFYLKDTSSTSGAALYIHGSTATESAMTYSYLTKTYSFTNPRDFTDNETTKKLAAEYLVTIKGYIKKVETDVFALTGIITAVQDPIVFTALEVDTKNVKTTYNLLDEFDASGLVVHAINDDLDTRELTATTDYSWSPTKFETEGTVAVTITGLGTYAELSESFNVTVKNIGFEISPNGDDIEAQTGDASIERSVINLIGFDTTDVGYQWTSSNTNAVTITNAESATATINIVGVGESTISIYVTDYTEELTKTFKVTVIEKQILFSKVSDTSQLIPGKEVMIANSDGSKVMGSQANNNRNAVAITKNGDCIIKTDDTAVFTLLPAKDGGFAFYDATAKNLLASVKNTSKNYLYTNGDYGDEHAYAAISIDKDGNTSITFKGNTTDYPKNQLKYNSQSTLFSCYSSGQAAISIYIAVEGDPESIGDTWAKQFNTTANCDPTGARTLSSDTWSTLKTEFTAQTIPEKMAASYLDTSSSVATDDFKKAVNNYMHCLTKYGYTGFINDRGSSTSSLSNNIYKSSDNNTAISIIVIVSIISVTTIGAYLFIRKRKQA